MALENNQIQNMNSDNDEISLKEIIIKVKEWIIFLKSNWKSIFIAGLIGALLGLTFALFVKPTYKAVLTFAMEEDKGNSGGGGGLSGALGLASSFGIDLGGAGGGAFAASNLAELMKSRFLVEKVLLEPIVINGKTISIAEYYIQINELRKSWDKTSYLKKVQILPNSDRINFTLAQDSILQQIYLSLTAKEKLNIFQKDKKVTILSVEVNNENELFAKIFCENLAKVTSNFYIETKSKKARINVNVLQKETDSIRQTLNGAINKVANETDNVYNLNPALNIKGAPSKNKQIDVQANTAILTNLVVQLELAKITLRKETPLIQLIDSPILPLQKTKTSKLKSLFLGILIAGFLMSLFLIIKEIFKKMFS